jgi:hypothetical protein
VECYDDNRLLKDRSRNKNDRWVKGTINARSGIGDLGTKGARPMGWEFAIFWEIVDKFWCGRVRVYPV